MRSITKNIALAFALSALAPIAAAGTVTVVTSFPKDLTQAYKTAFEKQNPGITVEILNKNTVSGIALSELAQVAHSFARRSPYKVRKKTILLFGGMLKRMPS